MGWTLHRDQTGPKLGLTSWWESSRTGTLGSQHVPWSCQGLLQGKWEKKGMENAQALSKSPPAPADCSKVSPKAKALHFSVNKEGIQLCYGGSRQALSPMQVLAGTEPLQTTSGSPGEAEMGSAPHCPR